MSNPLRERIRSGKVCAGVLTSMPSTNMAQTLSNSGFDWLFIDMEHGAIDIASCYNMITATSGTMCSPVVRVMEPSIAYTKPVLDSGAMGIVFPMITSKETAEAAVAAVRYPPIGERGWGPFYAPMRWQKKDPIEYYKSSDDVVIISLIEHIDAINNIEEIIKVEGIDVFFIAPSDLSQTMGHIGNPGHPEVQQAINTGLDKIISSGRVAGTLVNDDNVEQYVDRGVKFVMTSWNAWVERGSRGFLEKIIVN